MSPHRRIFAFPRLKADHWLPKKVASEPAPDQCIGRSAEAITNDLKHILTALLRIPAQERSQYFRGFQTLCAELEQGAESFPPEVKTKIDSLLWFCERMCRPDFVPSDGQSSFLAWPHTLLDAIKERLQGEPFHPSD